VKETTSTQSTMRETNATTRESDSLMSTKTTGNAAIFYASYMIFATVSVLTFSVYHPSFYHSTLKIICTTKLSFHSLPAVEAFRQM